MTTLGTGRHAFTQCAIEFKAYMNNNLPVHAVFFAGTDMITAHQRTIINFDLNVFGLPTPAAYPAVSSQIPAVPIDPTTPPPPTPPPGPPNPPGPSPLPESRDETPQKDNTLIYVIAGSCLGALAIIALSVCYVCKVRNRKLARDLETYSTLQ